jgi:hypothetical protein
VIRLRGVGHTSSAGAINLSAALIRSSIDIRPMRSSSEGRDRAAQALRRDRQTTAPDPGRTGWAELGLMAGTA